MDLWIVQMSKWMDRWMDGRLDDVYMDRCTDGLMEDGWQKMDGGIVG